MRRSVQAAGLVAALLGLLGIGLGVATAADPTVTIVDGAFDPSTITIDAGQTVFWTNTGQQPHTVTADDSSFDSGQLDHNDAFANLFEVPGTYTYRSIMPGDRMLGTVIVKLAPPTPVPSGPPPPSLPTGISPRPTPTSQPTATPVPSTEVIPQPPTTTGTNPLPEMVALAVLLGLLAWMIVRRVRESGSSGE
jgi:plastocyanin